MLPKLIGFAGKKGSGKDTAYNILLNLNPDRDFIRLAFADELKLEVARAIGFTVYDINKYKDNFRLILQGWGTDYRRKLYGEDYWINRWLAKIDYLKQHRPDSIIVATDVRFPNELEIIRKLGGKIFNIKKVSYEGDDLDEHESEQVLHNCDEDIINDFNDKTILIEEIKTKIHD